MQRPTRPILITLLAVGAGAGCSRTTPTVPTAAPPRQPLTLSCPDPAFASALLGRAAGWAGPRRRTVALGPEADADVRVVRPPDVGRLAAAGRAAPLPTDLKAPTHPLQWPRLLPAARGGLSGWAGETVAVPLAGDPLLLAVRTDRFDDPKHQAGFQARFNRPLAPPGTWEEVADVANYFADAAKTPSLPAVPTDPHRLLAEFHAAAACFDRRALVDADLKGGEPPATGFHFAADGTARLPEPGFRAAADWLAGVARCRGPEADPVAALTTGTAVLAVVSLQDVGRLPAGPDGVADRRVRVLPPPGSRTFFDAGKPARAAGRGGNFVPVLGSGGWVGLASADRPDPASAWELLAELAGPAATAARQSDPAVGAGPVRADAAVAGAWARYRLDPARTADLAAAVRQAVAVEVVNPAVVLRTPDAAARLGVLAEAVRAAASGSLTGEAAMRRAADAWAKQDAAADPADLKRWRRNAIGLP